MKASQLFFPTLREVPSEAEVISHQLLLRAGFIRKASGGVYSYLPLAYRVLKKIMNIIREEMDNSGGQEIMMPIIQPKELWEQSGRWELYGDEMFRLSDRHDRFFALGPTHEEMITTIVKNDIHSYRGLPLLLYQIQNKYRDEIRPRFGLMRGREFIMKDAYSFDIDGGGLESMYQVMMQTYNRIFARFKLKFRMVEADSGAIGGNESHEFMVLAESGENEIVYCSACDYAANVEKAEAADIALEFCNEEELPLEKMSTPNKRTIEEVSKFLNVKENRIIKSLLYFADSNPIMVLCRGDRDINEIKLKNVVGSKELTLADDGTANQILGASFGSLGPKDVNLPIYADLEVKYMQNAVCGANENGYHLINVNQKRDLSDMFFADLRNVAAGDQCPNCSQNLFSIRGIEVGQIFKLGLKYSEALDANFLDSEGNTRHMIMGCYGIGVSRTMAAAVEQNYDDDGIIWPLSIAPYQAIVIPVNVKNEEQMQTAVLIYEELLVLGIEAILDDRDERAGVKFKDADLIGIPLRITIGPKSLQSNQAELKVRWEKEISLVPIAGIVEKVKTILET